MHWVPGDEQTRNRCQSVQQADLLSTASPVVCLSHVLQDFLEWIRSGADPNAVYECPNSGQPASEGHAVAVVGYNNTEGTWLVKNRSAHSCRPCQQLHWQALHPAGLANMRGAVWVS